MTPGSSPGQAQTRRLMTVKQVCDEKLCRSTDWFYRNRKNLVRDHGFPTTLPGFPRHYDSKAIDCWLDSFIPNDAPEPDEPDELDAARKRLSDNARRMAGAGAD